MEQFSRVRVVTLDPQKNFESHSSSWRNGHYSLLSQIVAGFGPVAIDEFQRGHATLAFELDFDQLQRRLRVFVFAAADEQVCSLDCDFSYRQLEGILLRPSAMHLQRLAFKSRESAGPRLKS